MHEPVHWDDCLSGSSRPAHAVRHNSESVGRACNVGAGLVEEPLGEDLARDGRGGDVAEAALLDGHDDHDLLAAGGCWDVSRIPSVVLLTRVLSGSRSTVNLLREPR